MEKIGVIDLDNMSFSASICYSYRRIDRSTANKHKLFLELNLCPNIDNRWRGTDNPNPISTTTDGLLSKGIDNLKTLLWVNLTHINSVSSCGFDCGSM